MNEERAQPGVRDNALTGPAISIIGLPLDAAFSLEESRRPIVARVSPLTLGKKMPYQKCPLCGSVAHLNVSDPKSWYQHRYPELKFGSLVPGPCFACWQELKEGDDVEVRPGNPNTRPALYGQKGRIFKVVSSKECGTIFLVRIGERDEAFIRAELMKPREEKA